MKRWHWSSVVFLAALLTLALVGVARPGQGAERAAAQTPPFLSVDMDVTNGDGPCDIIDHSATHAVGATYKVAICLSDSTIEPAGLQFDLVYDEGLNQCVPATSCTGTGLDCNPDANAGTTTWGTSLGSGWDCSGGGVALPTCAAESSAQGATVAFMICSTVSGTTTLPIGDSVSAPIAEIEFTALVGGTDTLTLQNVSIIDANTTEFLNCNDLGECVNGTDIKSGATATPRPPTATPLPPTATPAYCGNPRQPTCTPTPRAFTPTPTTGPTQTPTVAPVVTTPPVVPTLPPPPPPSGGQQPVVVPPNTGEGSSSAPWTLPLVSLIALGAGALVGSGLYRRYARKS